MASALIVPVQRVTVESGPLPVLKGNADGRFVAEIVHDDDTQVIDLDLVVGTDVEGMPLHDREYLLRKLLHARTNPRNRAHVQAIDDAVEHVASGLVERGWKDPREVVTLHVPNLTDYEREVFRERLGRAYAASGDVFEQDLLSKARTHIQWLRWGDSERRLGRQIVEGCTRLREDAGLGATYDQRFSARVAEVKAEAPLTTLQIKALADEIAQAETLLRRYSAVTRAPHSQTTPKFQKMVAASLAPVVARAARTGDEKEADRLLAFVESEQGKDRGNVDLPRQRSDLFGALRMAGVAPHDVPSENRFLSRESRSCDGYTAGSSTTAWISARGVAPGQDVMSRPLTADLNYEHDLVHASHKLVAAHLVPALLGGEVRDDNLVPAVNTVNGWLADRPERLGKDLVLSSGTCIEYSVTCTFGRQPRQPGGRLADVVQQLVPSGITVVITCLRYDGRGDPRDWASYAPDASTRRPFAVPGDLMDLTPV